MELKILPKLIKIRFLKLMDSSITFLDERILSPIMSNFARVYLNYKLNKLCKLALHLRFCGTLFVIHLKFDKDYRNIKAELWLDNMDLAIMRSNSNLDNSQCVLSLYDFLAFHFIENTHYLAHINIDEHALLRYCVEGKRCFLKFKYVFVYKKNYRFFKNIPVNIKIWWKIKYGKRIKTTRDANIRFIDWRRKVLHI